MADPSKHDVTRLLREARAGDEGSRGQLFDVVYRELRQLAAAQLRREAGGVSWQPTELVNEAYLRLLQPEALEVHDRSHFFAVAGRIMRRILVDHFRRRHALKRGGGGARVTLGDAAEAAAEVDVLVLDEALTRLAELDGRKAKVVELRFFGGLQMDEVAAVLQTSKRTVEADWFFARAWLRSALEDGERP